MFFGYTLTKERKHFIQDSFEGQKFHFSYPSDIDDFSYLIKNFMQDKSEYLDNEIDEQIAITQLIVMNDASGLADKSEEFSNFLIVSRKYGFSCLYVFHTIYPGRQSWEMIMFQTHIFNFFPESIHSSRILKTLSLFASRQKNIYLPNQQVWLNRLYFQISNSKEKRCLTIDTRDINKLVPGKFRTSDDNEEEQTFYFNRNKSKTHFSYLIAEWIQNTIRFSIVRVKSDFDLVNKSLDIELKNSLVPHGRSEKQLQQTIRGDLSYARSKTEQSTDIRNQRHQQQRRNSGELDRTVSRKKSQDFSQKKTTAKIVIRHKVRYTATRIKYSPTRIKSRTFLSNISYTGINKTNSIMKALFWAFTCCL